MVRVVLNIIFLAIISPLILTDDPCKYTTSNGTIDISSLAGPSGSPRYKDVQPPGSGWKYSFNPCKPFSEGDHCKDASVCQISQDGSDQYILGLQDSAQWIPPLEPGSTPALKFEFQRSGSDLKHFFMESPANYYQFNWKNKCLCWNGCTGSSTTNLPSSTSLPQNTTTARN